MSRKNQNMQSFLVIMQLNVRVQGLLINTYMQVRNSYISKLTAFNFCLLNFKSFASATANA